MTPGPRDPIYYGHTLGYLDPWTVPGEGAPTPDVYWAFAATLSLVLWGEHRQVRRRYW